jgi:hypothetical protein
VTGTPATLAARVAAVVERRDGRLVGEVSGPIVARFGSVGVRRLFGVLVGRGRRRLPIRLEVRIEPSGAGRCEVGAIATTVP